MARKVKKKDEDIEAYRHEAETRKNAVPVGLASYDTSKPKPKKYDYDPHLDPQLNVISYVKNDHLDFSIPYDFLGVRHYYYPDFLLRYKAGDDEVMVVLEVKGYESEQDRQKRTAAERWVKAVNYHGGYGKWQLVECKDPRTVDKLLNGLFRI